MIRILFFVAVILALGLSFAWLADRPGEMILVWQGQRVETSLMIALAGLVALLVVAMVVLWLLKTIFTSPDTARRFMKRRRKERGYQALSRGLIAAGAGDVRLAKRMTQKTRGLIKPENEPLIHVLEAQTYMIEGRHDDARAKFEAMAEEPETRSLGLRGLYLEARRSGSQEAAKHYAERAVEKAPSLPWASEAALEYRSRDGDWNDAIRLVDKQRSAKFIDKQQADRKKAVLFTARGRERLEADPKNAANDAQEAVRLAPGFVPAAVTAAKAFYRLNDTRRGSRILEKAWKTNPHPEIADTYVRARSGDSVGDRLKRARKLEALKPNHVESLRIVAQAALDAQDYKLARESCEAALRQHPREGYYLLMADIEEAETGDQGRVRHWMSQALRAERDPAWTADGYVADDWAPVSPVTGKLDAFVWKVPVSQLSGPQIDNENNRPDADEAIRSLPPVAVDRTSSSPSGTSTMSSNTAPERASRPAEPAASAKKAPVTAPPAPEKATKTADAAPKPAAEPIASARTSDAKAPLGRPDKDGTVVIPLKPQAEKPSTEATPSTVKDAAAPAAKKDLSAKPATAAASDVSTRPSDELRSERKAAEDTAGDKPVESGNKRKAEDPDTEREKEFLSHRIDDPGVRETRQTGTENGSPFRLF